MKPVQIKCILNLVIQLCAASFTPRLSGELISLTAETQENARVSAESLYSDLCTDINYMSRKLFQLRFMQN